MLLHGSVWTAQIVAADALMLYISQSVREHVLGVIFFMDFIVSVRQEVADFVSVSVKLNQENNTSVVITERWSDYKGVREIVCVPICSSVYLCVCMFLCGYLDGCHYVYLRRSLCFCG